MTKQSKKRNFNGMSYHEVQRDNSQNRNKLKTEDQKWLKANGYKNVGWDNVISLQQKIEFFIGVEETTLEELFLAADRIGNKYLTKQEIEEFNQKLSEEVNEIADEIDKQFPDTENEVIDFSDGNRNQIQKKRTQKSCRTVK